MKNTVKKILALVFVVAMVCSLAVPAFAADDDITVSVLVLDRDGDKVYDKDVPLKSTNQTLEKALKTTNKVSISSTTGKITAVNNVKSTADNIVGEFGTGAWVVAVNGKLISENVSTVVLEDEDQVVVYWADTTLGTKLAQVDDSAIAQGILSFYYYDAEGNKQPLTNANVTIDGLVNKLVLDAVETNAKGNAVETNAAGYFTDAAYASTFVTDENGQIWIAPEYLAATKDGNVELKINSLTIEALKAKESDGYTKDEVKYILDNKNDNLEAGAVVGTTIVVEEGLYDVAGATGDMTIVYVLVAAAAVVTLGAVVVMKKKASKAN